MKITFSESTMRSATKRIVAARSRSSLMTAHGAWWSTYWFPMLESRIASASACLNFDFLDQRADGREAGLDGRESLAVLVGELAGLRHFSEVALRVRERAVDEIAPVREQLVVVAPQELRPREVAVLRLGPGGGEEVANGIRVVALEHVADVDRD